MTLFIGSKLCESHLEYASQLSIFFVQSFIDLYGREFVSQRSFNNSCNDCKKYGAFDNFSSFPFEIFYRSLTKLVRKGEKPLQQVAKRYLELKKNSCKPCSVRKQPEPFQGGGRHSSGVLLDDCMYPQYSPLSIGGGYTISSTSEADRCCLIGSRVVFVENFATDSQGGLVVVGKELLVSENMYDFPCPSSLLGIVYVQRTSRLKAWRASLITRKCFRMPWRKVFVIVPLRGKQ